MKTTENTQNKAQVQESQTTKIKREFSAVGTGEHSEHTQAWQEA